MHLSGTYEIAAPVGTVWTLLNDPDVIATCLPGCGGLEPLGGDRFKVSLAVAVAAISGRYDGTVALADKVPGRSYRLRVEGSGRAGFVNGDARIELKAFGGTLGEPSRTQVTVSGDGQVGGLMARVGQRLLGSVSQMLMDRFFAAFRERAERAVVR
jgi:uncharacterized protein